MKKLLTSGCIKNWGWKFVIPISQIIEKKTPVVRLIIGYAYK